MGTSYNSNTLTIRSLRDLVIVLVVIDVFCCSFCVVGYLQIRQSSENDSAFGLFVFPLHSSLELPCSSS